MIPRLDDYTLSVPASLHEALDDLAQHPGARPFAGGTDLMVVLEAGHLPAGRYVSLQNCRELLGIVDAGGNQMVEVSGRKLDDGVARDDSKARGTLSIIEAEIYEAARPKQGF